MENQKKKTDGHHKGDLAQRWRTLQSDQPKLRIRDAAKVLGVTEADLVASRCGNDVRRLQGPWGRLVEALPRLGTVMALTRNDAAVHEKIGRYGNVSIKGAMGLVLNEDIDLRLFLSQWAFGFAVTEETGGRKRRSLQFFAPDGTAVHKIYLREESAHRAFEALVGEFADEDQSPGVTVAPKVAKKKQAADASIDRDGLRDGWQTLQDVHDFRDLLRRFGAGRVQAFRLVGEDYARRVSPGSLRSALEMAAATSIPIMLFTGSPGVVQIHTGPVSNLKTVGPWFNVLDDTFNLHLREELISQAWVVRKPTEDGVVTSIEIFDEEESQIAWMFGARKRGQSEREDWRDIVHRVSEGGELVA